jgi:hypothetical protein
MARLVVVGISNWSRAAFRLGVGGASSSAIPGAATFIYIRDEEELSCSDRQIQILTEDEKRDV